MDNAHYTMIDDPLELSKGAELVPKTYDVTTILKDHEVYTEDGVTTRRVPSTKVMRGSAEFRNLFMDVLNREVTVMSAVTGPYQQRVSVAEAAILMVAEAALIKKQQWALEKILKEALHDGEDKIALAVEEKMDAATAAILSKAGVDIGPGYDTVYGTTINVEAEIIDINEIMNDDSTDYSCLD